jgi:hypothetical protein
MNPDQEIIELWKRHNDYWFKVIKLMLFYEKLLNKLNKKRDENN